VREVLVVPDALVVSVAWDLGDGTVQASTCGTRPERSLAFSSNVCCRLSRLTENPPTNQNGTANP